MNPKQRPSKDTLKDGHGVVDFSTMSESTQAELSALPRASRYWMILAGHSPGPVRDEICLVTPLPPMNMQANW